MYVFFSIRVENSVDPDQLALKPDAHKDIANTIQNKNIKDPQKKYRLVTVSKIFYWRA